MPTLRGMRRVQVSPELVTALLKSGCAGFEPETHVPPDLELEDATVSRLSGGTRLINLFVSSSTFVHGDEIKAYAGKQTAPLWEITMRRRAAT